MDDAVEEGAAMVAKGGGRIRVQLEVVFGARVLETRQGAGLKGESGRDGTYVGVGAFVRPRTLEGHVLMAALVHHKAAHWKGAWP